jgi:pyridoxal phosphate enzyme (YggS family)
MTPFPPLGSTISERIATIRQTLPDSVRLIAVSKQVSVAAIRQAYAAGIRDFGESRVQEAEEKQAQLSDLSDICWHLIGHLQANKAQKALERFDWLHSIDSLKLAQRLNRLVAEQTQKPRILLQVKILPDPNKHGWDVAQLLTDLDELNQLNNLDIRGIMTIPPLGLTAEELFNFFAQTHELACRIQQQRWLHISMDELSMGMSDDYPLAVKAGSTMVRLGRILFGDRPT